MKKILQNIALCVLFGAACHADVFEPAKVLLPLPREITMGEGTCPADAKPVDRTDSALPAEGYVLEIAPDGIAIASRDEAGGFYARQTLKQIADVCPEALPCMKIKDWPQFAWRGVMLDEARTFFGKIAVKKLLDEMARYKLNVFHWHLTDDQAWRIAIPGWPNLVRRSRKLGLCAGESELWYSAADIKEILAYAAGRQITVVPEIDFPGHFGCAIRAYPKLSCTGKGNVLCAGNPEAIAFAENVLDCVCELFPSSVIHVGGDECPRHLWKKCPKCRDLMKREGIKSELGIQPWLTRQLASHLEAKGRRLCGWEEIAVGFGKPDERGESNNNSTLPAELLPPKSVMVMGYHVKPGARAANMGYDLIAAPNWHCYFDYSQLLPEDPYEYFRPDIRWCPLEAAHAFAPYELVEPLAHDRVKGVECCLWTSHTYSRSFTEVEWKLWPRTFAVAEAGWTCIDPRKRSFDEFLERAAHQRRRQLARHVNCAPLK